MQGARLCQPLVERANRTDRGVELALIEITTRLRQRLDGIPQKLSQAIELDPDRLNDI